MDILSQALGTPEHVGRVRGVGKFVTPSSFWGPTKRTRRGDNAEMTRMREEMEAMKQVLSQLTSTAAATSGKMDHVGTSSHSPHVTDIGTPSPSRVRVDKFRPPTPPPASKYNLREKMFKMKSMIASSSGAPQPDDQGYDVSI